MGQTREAFLLANAERFVGQEIALTDWITIDQDQVDRFGAVTRWPTWMHVDPERCARESPYGGTLVHGFLVLSLLSYFMEASGVRPKDGARSLNYGLDKVRVMQPIVTGDGVRLRDRISLLSVTDRGHGRKLLKTGHEIEVAGLDGLAVYAEYLNYWFPRARAERD